MSRWKYRRLMSAQPGTILPNAHDVPSFDLDRLRARGLKARIIAWLFRALLWPILRLCQILRPVIRFGDLAIVTRADDVRAILADTNRFRVPFGPEMNALAGGDTFVLGLDGPEHDRQRQLILHQLIRPAIDLPLISRLSQDYADALLDAGKGRIDSQRDLMMRVAAETCARYMGFSPKDANSFADWSLAGSNVLFADPQGNALAGELAAKAGANLRALVDRALEKADRSRASGQDSLAARLVALEQEPAGPTRGQSRAILIGLAVGFVPTNSLAGGKIIDFLARNPEARKEAIAAARAGDDARLRRTVLEAARLSPALAPGQWRWCPDEVNWTAASGTKVTIPAQTLVLVSTMAALRDPAAFPRPGRFRTDRPGEPELLFGHLSHQCLGKELALAQIVPTIAALLRRKGVERSLECGGMQWLGPFPDRFIVTYEDPAVDRPTKGIDQNGVLFAVPVSTGEAPAQINLRIDRAMDSIDWRAALNATGLIHFMSVTAAEVAAAEGSQTLVMIEVNCDGPGEAGGRAALSAIGGPLRDIFALQSDDDVWNALAPHRVRMHGKPWGATALNFFGLPGLSVREIARQAELAAYAREAVNTYQKLELGRSSRAAGLLQCVRRLIRQDPELVDNPDWRKLAAGGASFERMLLRPLDRHLPLSDWDPADQTRGWFHVLRSRLSVQIALSFAVLSIVAGVALNWALDPGHGQATPFALSLPWLALQSIAAALVFLAMLAGLFVAALRWKERNDPVDQSRPTMDHLRALAEREDLPGHVKNHITVVTPLKPGLVRRLSLALALWGIGKLVTYFYRPGFVLSMGTIQFARWVRLPRTGTMIFQSNYDGSWESYLEDFITRAHAGQTAAWSNAAGFPRSRFLIFDGAQDGDSFKHYVRGKQVPTAFWYSRFPDLTADQIRRNALIHDGLARATSDSEARAWLSLFGSAPRTDGEIEGEEVQAIVFNGFAKLPYAEYLMLALPEDSDMATVWLQVLTGYKVDDRTKSRKSLLADLLDPRGLLASENRVAFGESDPLDGAASIAFSARGLRTLLGARHKAIDELPGPFAMGMRERAARLGDVGDEDPANWRWTDDPDSALAVDVLVAVYSPTPEAHARAVERHRKLAELFGLRLVASQSADALEAGGFPRDHFGFRDGIVQPIIEGAIKADRARNSLDIVATGEMIYGYRNAQGFFPPAICVPAEDDMHDLLPDLARTAERYPRFGKRRSRRPDTDLRDFGRNGTFMAVRVLEQHPDTFHEACLRAADGINTDYRHIAGAISVPIDEKWVAAKMVGRWQSGASLIGNPTDPDRMIQNAAPGRTLLAKGSLISSKTTKSFPATGAYMVQPEDYILNFGRDDPRGLQCPLGAHVRRANPRDSLQPGDEQEVGIVNRHRLMRRGRNYGRDADEKGLFFIAICEDLERQFEFVQRSWLQAEGFHDLNRESDPLIGHCPVGEGTFSIPTHAGTITARGLSAFTTMRAGGYFFLPSRSALRYLANPHNRSAT